MEAVIEWAGAIDWRITGLFVLGLMNCLFSLSVAVAYMVKGEEVSNLRDELDRVLSDLHRNRGGPW